MSKCLVCPSFNADLHHVKSRGSGGGDEPYNLARLCREHHTEIHFIGLTTFANKYDDFKKWLLLNKWELVNNKWKHF